MDVTDSEVVEAVKQQVGRKTESLRCSECGCNFVHPNNSNFVLVYSTGMSIMLVQGAQTATMGPLKMVWTLLNPSSFYGMIDLSKDDVREMTGGNMWEMLEDVVECYNVSSLEGGGQVCPLCAEKLGLNE